MCLYYSLLCLKQCFILATVTWWEDQKWDYPGFSLGYLDYLYTNLLLLSIVYFYHYVKGNG